MDTRSVQMTLNKIGMLHCAAAVAAGSREQVGGISRARSARDHHRFRSAAGIFLYLTEHRMREAAKTKTRIRLGSK